MVDLERWELVKRAGEWPCRLVESGGAAVWLANHDLIDQSQTEDSVRHFEGGLKDELLGVVGAATASKDDVSIDAVHVQIADPPAGGAFDVALEALGEVIRWGCGIGVRDGCGERRSSHVVIP